MIKMQLFGKSSKSPAEAVKVLKESLVLLERGSDGKKQEKALEEVRYVWYRYLYRKVPTVSVYQ